MAVVEGDHEDDYRFLKNFPPKTPHVVLSAEQIGSKDVFVIGDVHGCYDELVALLEKAGVRNNPNVIIIFVGDLINKGPKNKEVLRLVRDIGALSVRGNHDQKSLYQVVKLKEDETYPIRSKYEWLRLLDDTDIELLSQLPFTISIPSLDAMIVHAGLVPGHPLPEQDPWDMMKMRNVMENINSDGSKSYEAIEDLQPGHSWSKMWPGPEHVYYGHDARRRLNKSPYATGLDSGCVYGGELTGVFLTGSKQFVSVNANSVTPQCS
ncbi:bis(5'-nucleosyl)-tetraphosphatase PrpE [asymmetrical]-like [Amphiura filiformis]|uniref:bis(5'-nucleosyl)-tetraphosphatase PrpE [asymmetrical]-like n=1 Tax=Amphiura filiformis TaxID=82378 RepID=UPI003B20D5B2